MTDAVNTFDSSLALKNGGEKIVVRENKLNAQKNKQENQIRVSKESKFLTESPFSSNKKSTNIVPICCCCLSMILIIASFFMLVTLGFNSLISFVALRNFSKRIKIITFIAMSVVSSSIVLFPYCCCNSLCCSSFINLAKQPSKNKY